MKILDRYILTSFVKTFASAFTILFFIFILQGIWLFIDQLAGKDLEFFVIVKFLGYYSPTMVPLVLPLSILLASIMTFGSFSENYEFAAMKSSGISLGRAMRSLTVFIFLLSIVAFFFANNVIPQAQYKFTSLRKNIIQKKPAMAIVEGQFNAVGSFNIKVDKKSGENGEKLTGVTIHKKKLGSGTGTVIRAKRGLLKSSDKSNLLQLELYDGYYYEDIQGNSSTDREKMPFAKSSFSRQLMNIDLTALNSESMDDEQITHTNNMLNLNELSFTLDSLEKNYKREAKSVAENLAIRPAGALTPTFQLKKDTTKTKQEKKTAPKDLLSVLTAKDDKTRVLELAANNVGSTDYVITSGKNGLEEKIKNINGHWIAFYDKFVIAYACIMMFFIGAPLGAIIRKGGLGLPIVFAVLIFIIFHFINTFGKKVAQENGIPPFMGSWMSSFVLTPFAILFTYRATNDMNLVINMEWLTVPLAKLFSKKKLYIPVVRLDTFIPVEDEEWQLMNSYDDVQLKQIVLTSKQYNYTELYRKKALKILDNRGITQEMLKEEGYLYDRNYLELEILAERYKIYSVIGLVVFAAAALLIKAKLKPAVMIVRFAVIALLYVIVFVSEKNLRGVFRIASRKNSLPAVLAWVFGPVLYIILYFYNKKNLKGAIEHYKSPTVTNTNYDNYDSTEQNQA